MFSMDLPDTEEFTLSLQRVDEDIRERLFYAFADAHCAILSMAREKQSLEDVFLTLTAGNASAQQGGDAQ